MIKTLEKSGRTEEDALNAALRELGCDRDDVSVEIVERAKSGFLGIGAVQAVIRVSYEAPDEPQAPAAKAPKPQNRLRLPDPGPVRLRRQRLGRRPKSVLLRTLKPLRPSSPDFLSIWASKPSSISLTGMTAA